jgi:hypothetical protein
MEKQASSSPAETDDEGQGGGRMKRVDGSGSKIPGGSREPEVSSRDPGFAE